MEPQLTDWVTAVSAIVATVVSCVALYIAWRGPRTAALFAEELRRVGDITRERDRTKMAIFTTLMKCRKQILHPEAVAALNLVDVYFMDSVSVRAAYKSFISATLEEVSNPVRIVERYHSLIDKIASDLGFKDLIGPQDVQQGYYPSGMVTLDEAVFADAEDKIARRNRKAVRDAG